MKATRILVVSPFSFKISVLIFDMQDTIEDWLVTRIIEKKKKIWPNSDNLTIILCAILTLAWLKFLL